MNAREYGFRMSPLGRTPREPAPEPVKAEDWQPTAFTLELFARSDAREAAMMRLLGKQERTPRL